MQDVVLSGWPWNLSWIQQTNRPRSVCWSAGEVVEKSRQRVVIASLCHHREGVRIFNDHRHRNLDNIKPQMSNVRRRMGSQYDDWGNPILPPSYPVQREPGLVGLVNSIRSVCANLIRRHRTLIGTVLFALCLLFYWNTGEPRARPVDWKNFAYVQYVSKVCPQQA